MSIFHLVLLALVQGITEFLPISSSGHLILLPRVLDIPDQGTGLDVAVHVGTLGAVVVYFWHDVRRAALGLMDLATGQRDTARARLAFLLIVATVPVVLLGLVLKVTDLVSALRSITVIGWTTLVFGILLYVIDRVAPARRKAEDWSLRDAVIMGLWQAIALIPGTSRSGITITGARALGYDREDGTRLAMLMSIPTILASGVLLAGDAVAEANWQLARDAAIGGAMSFVAALLALAVMMRFLNAVSFTPYVIYRVILGVVLLSVAYS